ncbi:PaaI family thioesterase [Roseovarius spongiae]|uniref:PaaI family thioesterase n=1 Tax=Roseovarius spongiae TaxID=2320272 RepID=A0A3A8AYU4_9RHOB|nr:PaaI family thioesterase [Roseovarius spongiae]RKF17106.1 PaaI family thioesterase [Roseovarius spongiae]
MSPRSDATKLPLFPTNMGVRLTQAQPDRVTGTLEVTEALANRNDVLHGGAVMTFADTLAGTAATLNLGDGQRTTTIESKTNFLRAIRIGEEITGASVPVHVGRKTAVFQTTITRADGKVAAIVTQTQMTLSWEPPGQA